MFDHRLIPLQRRLLSPVAEAAAAAGIAADRITIAGFLLGVAAIPFLSAGQFWVAVFLIVLNRLFDGLDGEVARRQGASDRGAFLDISLDFVFYALVPLGFALNQPEVNGLAAAVLIASFVGTGSSFLAFSLIAERRSMSSVNFPKKGIYYTGGLAEGAETIVVFMAMCVLPDYFVPLALGFAAVCAVTTVSRWVWVHRLLSAQPRLLRQDP